MNTVDPCASGGSVPGLPQRVRVQQRHPHLHRVLTALPHGRVSDRHVRTIHGHARDGVANLRVREVRLPNTGHVDTCPVPSGRARRVTVTVGIPADAVVGPGGEHGRVPVSPRDVQRPAVVDLHPTPRPELHDRACLNGQADPGGNGELAGDEVDVAVVGAPRGVLGERLGAHGVVVVSCPGGEGGRGVAGVVAAVAGEYRVGVSGGLVQARVLDGGGGRGRQRHCLSVGECGRGGVTFRAAHDHRVEVGVGRVGPGQVDERVAAGGDRQVGDRSGRGGVSDRFRADRVRLLTGVAGGVPGSDGEPVGGAVCQTANGQGGLGRGWTGDRGPGAGHRGGLQHLVVGQVRCAHSIPGEGDLPMFCGGR